MGVTARRRLVALAAGLLIHASALPALAGNDAPAQQGRVPTTIPDGTVIATDKLAELIRQSDPVLIDVAPSPHRPAGQTGSTPWLPPQHRSIVKSVWIPGAGAHVVLAATADYFRDTLARLTGGDHNRRIVVYCHPECWLSWNAAKRAIGKGYRQVYWYPGGIESWQDAGLPTAITRPEGPEAK